MKFASKTILNRSRDAFFVCLTLLLAGIASAQLATAAAVPGRGTANHAPPVAASTQRVQPETSRHQAIEVSGWWKIDVKDPNGKVVQHREFENAVTNIGAKFLVYLLTGQATSGPVTLNLVASTGQAPCTGQNAALGCFLASQAVNQFPFCATVGDVCTVGLTVTVVPQANNSANLNLSGSFVAQRDGTIDTVASFFGQCAATTTTSATMALSPTSPAQCTASGTFDDMSLSSFTLANPTAISVSSGQTVQVSVTFSFSSVV